MSICFHSLLSSLPTPNTLRINIPVGQKMSVVAEAAPKGLVC